MNIKKSRVQSEIKQIKDDNSSYIFCNDQTQKQLDKSFKLIEEEINRSKS
jgi:hypothetical protein